MTKRGTKRGYHNRQESQENKNKQGWKSSRPLYQIPEQEDQVSGNFNQYQDLQYDNYQYRLRRTSRRGKTGRKHRHRMGGFQGTVSTKPGSEKVPHTPINSAANDKVDKTYCNKDEETKKNKDQFNNAMMNYMFDKSATFAEESKTHLEYSTSANNVDGNLVGQKIDVGLLGIALTISGMTIADVDDVPEVHRLMMATMTQMTSNQSLAEATNIIYDGQGNLINLSVPPPNYHISFGQPNSDNPLVYLSGESTKFEQINEPENSPTATQAHDGILEQTHLPNSNDVGLKKNIENQCDLFLNNAWTQFHIEPISLEKIKILQEIQDIIINFEELATILISGCEQLIYQKKIEKWEINESQIIEISNVHVNDLDSSQQSLLIAYENQTMHCQTTFINDEMSHQHDTSVTSVRQTNTISIISQVCSINNDTDQLINGPEINSTSNSIQKEIVHDVSKNYENNKIYQINRLNWDNAFNKPMYNNPPSRDYLYEFKKTAVNVPTHLKEKHIVKGGVWAERNIDSNEAFAEFQRRMTDANVIIGNNHKTTTDRNLKNKDTAIEKNDEEKINFQCETKPKKVLSPIGSKRKIDRKPWYPEFPVKEFKYDKNASPEMPSYTEADLFNIDFNVLQDMWSPNMNIATSSPKSETSTSLFIDIPNSKKNVQSPSKIPKLDLTVACFFETFSCLNRPQVI